MRSLIPAMHFFVVALLTVLTTSIEVSPDSECSSLCDNNPSDSVYDPSLSKTYTDELVCYDWELAGPNSTTAGRKWKDCLQCESQTAHSFGGSNQVYWFSCSCSPSCTI